MALFHRRETPPPDLVARLMQGERVLAWADVASGETVLATSRGLWWPEPDGAALIGWQHVDKVQWSEGILSVTAADVIDDLLLLDRAPLVVELVTPRNLPAVVRKRVEANIVRSEVRELDGGQARFVARRVPGRDGLTWWVRLEGGLVDSDEVRSQVDAERAALQAQWAQARL